MAVQDMVEHNILASLELSKAGYSGAGQPVYHNRTEPLEKPIVTDKIL